MREKRSGCGILKVTAFAAFPVRDYMKTYKYQYDYQQKFALIPVTLRPSMAFELQLAVVPPSTAPVQLHHGSNTPSMYDDLNIVHRHLDLLDQREAMRAYQSVSNRSMWKSEL
ncbi:unnamed protein product, partial [Didymodactylos carnosus]